MSLFKNLFGSKEKSPTLSECINNVRDLERLLVKKIQYTNEQIKSAEDTAEKATSKRIQTQNLNRKIRLENQVEKLQGTLKDVRTQLKNLESVKDVEDIKIETHIDSNNWILYVLVGLGAAILIGRMFV